MVPDLQVSSRYWCGVMGTWSTVNDMMQPHIQEHNRGSTRRHHLSPTGKDLPVLDNNGRTMKPLNELPMEMLEASVLESHGDHVGGAELRLGVHVGTTCRGGVGGCRTLRLLLPLPLKGRKAPATTSPSMGLNHSTLAITIAL